MKKWSTIIGIAVLVLLLLVASAWLWLTRSESGARWALARAAGAVERLEYDALSGGLASGIEFDGLRFAHAGMRLDADRLELAASIDLFAGPLVVIRHLRGRDIAIHLPDGEAEPETGGEPFDLSTLASPVDVTVEEIDLHRLSVHAGEEPLRIERIALAGHYGEDIELDRLEIVSDMGRAEAQGRWALERRGRGRLALSASTELADDAGQSIRLTVDGRIDALDVELSTTGPAALEGRGRLRGLPQMPTVEIELNGGLQDWPGLPLSIRDLALSLSGQPSDWRAESSARVTGPDIPPGEWSLAVSGGTQSLAIESLDARILDGRIAGSGQLDWSESAPSSRASLQFESLDLTPLYPQWPNQGRIGGELVASTREGVIEIERLALQADPGELSVTGNGRIDPGGDSVDVTLEWQQFAWPPVTDESEPMVASESGRIRLEGRISDWRAEVEAMLDSPHAPAARIQARASGSREQADIRQLTIDAGQSGSLALDGAVTWAPRLSASVQLTLDQFDPGVLVNQLPGRVDGRAGIDLVRDEQLQVDIDLTELDGRLRGQTLAGSGQLTWVDDRPEAADLSLSLGENRIAVSSREQAAWEAELEAVALDQLWPGLAGQARLAGELQPAEGRLALDGRVEGLRWEDYDLEQADIDLKLAWLDRPEVDLTVSAGNLDLRPWDRVEQLELTLEGGCEQHRLELTTSGARGNLELAAGGRLTECLEGDPAWRGEIERLYLGETLAGDWRLAATLPLTVSAGNVQAESACLTTSADTPARLCLEELSVGDTGRVAAHIEQVPMDLLLLPLDPVFSLATPLSGRVEAGWDAAGLSRLDGELRLGSGVLKAIGGEQELLSVDSAQLDLEPGDDPALTVGLRAQLEGSTKINGQARLADLRDLAGTQLEGEAILDLPDIAAFAHLIPQLDRIGGAANGRIELAGPITAPSVSGRVAISNGRIVHAPLGLDVRAIELELSGTADRASLDGSAESGDGQLRLSGRASLLDDGWRVDSRIEGERFTFAAADWLQLAASPKISLEAQPGRVNIDGDIPIDRLRGGLPPGSANRVAPSADVEVVGEEPEEDAPATRALRRIQGRLGIDLGEDARLATEGFETELAGDLELLWDGPPRPKGRGTIRLTDGSYQAYGQTLEINDGEVIFTAQPIDDPRLDLRAVRDIFGDPEVEVAGVQITGSARRPEIELYTDPPTSQEKALAYIVTGSDFDHSGGQGALNVGFYLLRNLFVSYGVGLFETGNVLSGRYELSRHWGVRVVSGERDTGVDLSYTVNK